MDPQTLETKHDALIKKWGEVLDHKNHSPIKDKLRRGVTAAILENAEREKGGGALLMETPTNSSGTDGFTTSSASTGPVAGYDSILINLIRRTMPNLVSYDIMGVQPLSTPGGLIFALRSMYNAPSGVDATEAFYNEANTAFSGAGTQSGGLGTSHTATTGTGMTTAAAEALGSGSTPWPEMGISLESVTARVRSRGLKASWSTELDRDLRQVHGLDAQSEMTNMLASEILAELNREAIRTVYSCAVTGAQGTQTPGTFNLDTDADGRWMGEKFKGLLFQLDRESLAIARGTRRGRGNIVICSSEVAQALEYSGVMDFTPALNTATLEVDDTGNTFAGILNKRYRVYIDPYAAGDYMVVGYKGSSPWDAGAFYCPYAPLELHSTIGSASLQPVIGFKTRYAMVANPFAGGLAQGDGTLTANSNVFYRRMLVRSI